jgi:hypothetical protein
MKTKILIFSLILLFVGFLFNFKLIEIFKGNLSFFNLIYLLVYFLIFLSFLLVFYLISETRIITYLTIFLFDLIFIILYFVDFCQKKISSFNFYLLLPIFIFFILKLLSYELIVLEKEDRLKLNLRKIWKAGLSLIIFSFSFFICSFYYFYPLIKINKKGIEIPPKLFNFLIEPFSKFLPYPLDSTIDEILKKEIFDEKILPIDQKLKKEIIENLKKIDNSLIVQERNELSKMLGFKLTGKEKFSEILNRLLNSKLNEILKPYLKYLSLVIVIVLFFLIKFILGLLSIFSLILAQIIFALIKLFRVVEIIKVMKEGETIKI